MKKLSLAIIAWERIYYATSYFHGVNGFAYGIYYGNIFMQYSIITNFLAFYPTQ